MSVTTVGVALIPALIKISAGVQCALKTMTAQYVIVTAALNTDFPYPFIRSSR